MIYAIIPARSGSRGIPHKNIKPLAGKELLGYSIEFANKLEIDRVFCSTDSNQYAIVAKKFGAEVPFLRSPVAASDKAMEHQILADLYEKFRKHGIAQPELIVWLRPTFVFREIDAVRRCIKRMLDEPAITACRTVCETDARLYFEGKNGNLIAGFEDHGKSMIRRQDMKKAYKVFSTDVIRSSAQRIDEAFLGQNIAFEAIPKICGLDIDDEFDFKLVESIIKNCPEFTNGYL